MALLSYAYTTVANVEAVLGLSAGAQTTALELAINGWTDRIERITQNSWRASTYTVNERVSGTGTNVLLLPFRTDTVPSSVSVYEVSDDGTETLIASSTYYIDQRVGAIYREPLSGDGFARGGVDGGVWTLGLKNYRVSYDAGAAVPADVTLLCTELAAESFRELRASGIVSETLADYTYQRAQSKDLSAAQMDRLRPYMTKAAAIMGFVQ